MKFGLRTTHTIRVDDEVYAELKRRTEPWTDTPNEVLRKVLFPPRDPAQAKKRSRK